MILQVYFCCGTHRFFPFVSLSILIALYVHSSWGQEQPIDYYNDYPDHVTADNNKGLDFDDQDTHTIPRRDRENGNTGGRLFGRRRDRKRERNRDTGSISRGRVLPRARDLPKSHDDMMPPEGVLSGAGNQVPTEDKNNKPPRILTPPRDVKPDRGSSPLKEDNATIRENVLPNEQTPNDAEPSSHTTKQILPLDYDDNSKQDLSPTRNSDFPKENVILPTEDKGQSGIPVLPREQFISTDSPPPSHSFVDQSDNMNVPDYIYYEDTDLFSDTRGRDPGKEDKPATTLKPISTTTSTTPTTTTTGTTTTATPATTRVIIRPTTIKTTPSSTTTTTTSHQLQENRSQDLKPIIEEVGSACCTLPYLDCRMIGRRIQPVSQGESPRSFGEHKSHTSSFQHGQPTQEFGFRSEHTGARFRRQISLPEQHIDHLGVNLLRFQSCLCQANRGPSACRMLFPPGFYTPTRPGKFDVVFNSNMHIKRFQCTFYNGNIVDCLFLKYVPYHMTSTSAVQFVVDEKARDSGPQCTPCNSFYCTFDSFMRREQAFSFPFNQYYKQCVANRSGMKLPRYMTTTPTLLPRWTQPPVTPRQGHAHTDANALREMESALRDLSLITGKGILLGLGRFGGPNTALQDLYDIKPNMRGGFHPILDHAPIPKHQHSHNFSWIVVLSSLCGLFAGILLISLVVLIVWKRNACRTPSHSKSSRRVPIVQMDDLEPSPSGDDPGSHVREVRSNVYEYKRTGSEPSGYSGSIYGTTDSLGYSGISDSNLPVARVVPFAKPARRPTKQGKSTLQNNSQRTRARESFGEGESHLRNHFNVNSPSSSPNIRIRDLTHRTSNTSNSIPTSPSSSRTRKIQSPFSRTGKPPDSSLHQNKTKSPIQIYSTTGIRPRVPPRNVNILPKHNELPTEEKMTTFKASRERSKLSPRGLLNTSESLFQIHSRTNSNQSTQSNTFHRPTSGADDPNNRKDRSSLSNEISERSGKTVTTNPERKVKSLMVSGNGRKRRSAIPSIASSRGSKLAQGFYYDVDSECVEYTDTYASIYDDEEGHDDADDHDNSDERHSQSQKQGLHRYETRICSDEELFSDLIEEVNEKNGVIPEDGEQYEVPVMSDLLHQSPTKTARNKDTENLENCTLPSTLAPPIPRRRRNSSSSSSSSSTLSSTGKTDLTGMIYMEGSRPGNEYTDISDEQISMA